MLNHIYGRDLKQPDVNHCGQAYARSSTSSSSSASFTITGTSSSPSASSSTTLCRGLVKVNSLWWRSHVCFVLGVAQGNLGTPWSARASRAPSALACGNRCAARGSAVPSTC